MDIKKELSEFKKGADKRLNHFFNRKFKQSSKIDPLTVDAVKKIRDFTLVGGQRIRPLFAYYGYLAAEGRNKKAMLNACLCTELVQSYMLIHDDIIDRDVLRRGQPTVHVRYANQYKKISGDFNHLGLAGAILAGDLAASYCYEILDETNFKPQFKIKAIMRLNQMMETVLNGQIMDIFLGVGRQLTSKDIHKILRNKTASYTVEGPLQIGAILAGASAKTLSILKEYGIFLGIAFQLKDDILGMFGNKKVTGKSDSSDIKEGKQTLLITEAKKRATVSQRKIITQTLGNQHATVQQINSVKKIVTETGALASIIKEAEKYADQAKAVVDKSAFPGKVKSFLIEITDYIVYRDR